MSYVFGLTVTPELCVYVRVNMHENLLCAEFALKQVQV